MEDTKVACIVPLHNTSVDTIEYFIRKLPSRIAEVYLSINDKELLGHYKPECNLRNGISVLEIPFQVGKAEAYRWAMEQMLFTTRCNIIAQTDGRLKQPPEELDNLIDALIERNHSMVIADRYTYQDLEGQEHRIAISNMLASIIDTITPYSCLDVACGTRVYKKSMAKEFLNLRGFGYGLEVEQILICTKHKALVSSVPVSSNRQHGVTNAEKIEDVLFALISYCCELGVPEDIKHLLCHMLVQVKKREDFEVDLQNFKRHGCVLWKYFCNNTADGKGVYSTQTPEDGYALCIQQNISP